MRGALGRWGWGGGLVGLIALMAGGLWVSDAEAWGIGASDPPGSAFEVASRLQDAFAEVAERVAPAVVSIEVELDPAAVASAGGDASRARVGYGTGFIVSDDGLVLTNSHVVAPARRLTVILEDRREFPARVVGHDPTTDVALLRVEARGLPAAPLGDDRTARVGDWVLSIGNPYGLERTVTQGIISAKGRTQVGASRGAYAVRDFIQTDASMNVGSSGGPLVDIRGRVIGLNARIASGSGVGEGYGFAIPITLVREVMGELLEHGRVRRPVLGAAVAEVRMRHAEAAGLGRAGIDGIRGAVVAEVVGGAAERAGVRAGDVIVAVEGSDVAGVAELQRAVRGAGPGAALELTVVREGALHRVTARLDEARDDEPVPSVAPGITLL